MVHVTNIAILDDYIGVALDYGDWAALPASAQITVYRQAIPPERLVEELFDYEIIVITQQRARFPRAVLEGLSNLKLIVCNGRTSNVIDHRARIERSILLCGTADTEPGSVAHSLDRPRGLPAPAEMAWALIFAVASGSASRTERFDSALGRPDFQFHSLARPSDYSARVIWEAQWSLSRRRSVWTWSPGART